jgi:hypothetical protein
VHDDRSGVVNSYNTVGIPGSGRRGPGTAISSERCAASLIHNLREETTWALPSIEARHRMKTLLCEGQESEIGCTAETIPQNL